MLPAMRNLPSSEPAALGRFWRRHVRLVATLTAVWAAAAFTPALLGIGAGPAWSGVPLSMWFMAELAPLVFVGIAWFYARRADMLDAEYADRDA
jgi:putative solute:sodium symporter small subunit